MRTMTIRARLKRKITKTSPVVIFKGLGAKTN
jgi:hypothetical protein